MSLLGKEYKNLVSTLSSTITVDLVNSKNPLRIDYNKFVEQYTKFIKRVSLSSSKEVMADYYKYLISEMYIDVNVPRSSMGLIDRLELPVFVEPDIQGLGTTEHVNVYTTARRYIKISVADSSKISLDAEDFRKRLLRELSRVLGLIKYGSEYSHFLMLESRHYTSNMRESLKFLKLFSKGAFGKLLTDFTAAAPAVRLYDGTDLRDLKLYLEDLGLVVNTRSNNNKIVNKVLTCNSDNSISILDAGILDDKDTVSISKVYVLRDLLKTLIGHTIERFKAFGVDPEYPGHVNATGKVLGDFNKRLDKKLINKDKKMQDDIDDLMTSDLMQNAINQVADDIVQDKQDQQNIAKDIYDDAIRVSRIDDDDSSWGADRILLTYNTDAGDDNNGVNDPDVALQKWSSIEEMFKESEVFWSNPKPSKKPIKSAVPKVGMYALVNGEKLVEITEVGDVIKYQVDGTNSFGDAPKDEVYPCYEVSFPAKLGDVLIHSDYGPCILTSKEQIEFIGKNLASIDTKLYRHTDINSKSVIKNIVVRYSDGVLFDKTWNCKISDEDLKSAKYAATTIEDLDVAYNLKEISDYFNVKETDLVPKEDRIMETLKVTLDHPLNTEVNEWALLLGPSGTGKTTLAIQYCEEHNLDYVTYHGNQQVTVDDLKGYNSITTGEYFPSLLRDAVENGKVFIFDEIDACNPNTLLALNALKGDKYQFPDKEGLVKVHKDFKIIATANTLSYSEEYNGRTPMDRATIKRFNVIYYDLQPFELALRFDLDIVKELQDSNSLNSGLGYPEGQYKLLDDYSLQPTSELDPRDIQRIQIKRKIKDEMKG